jgi:hypothetical protein
MKKLLRVFSIAIFILIVSQTLTAQTTAQTANPAEAGEISESEEEAENLSDSVKPKRKIFNLNLGVEASGYTRDGVAPGAVLNLSFSIFPGFMLGIEGGYHNSFSESGLQTIEAGQGQRTLLMPSVRKQNLS